MIARKLIRILVDQLSVGSNRDFLMCFSEVTNSVFACVLLERVAMFPEHVDRTCGRCVFTFRMFDSFIRNCGCTILKNGLFKGCCCIGFR